MISFLKKYSNALLIPFAFICFGCSASVPVSYDIPPDWKSDTQKHETIKRFSQALNGKKIFIDPGHGGEDRRNTGNLKLVTEADINLKVSLALRDYLQEAGAVVYMSRTSDVTVGLKERSKIANATDADFFISVHHNAPGSPKDSWIDYTSTYYHATETDYEYEPCQHDMARYIQRDLAFVMDNSGGLGSFDGTYSDYHIYPKEGFSVLRNSSKPSILIEAGFFTNNSEERKLALEEYNNIQAWGIFRGYAKYLTAGIPQIVPSEENATYKNNSKLVFFLKDKNGIDENSVVVYADSVKTSFDFDVKENKITLWLDKFPSGEHSLRIICANKNGNHSLPFHSSFITNTVFGK